MNAVEAIRTTIEFGTLVSLGYLEDLSDQDLMHRACPGINHINWQWGHLIVSEHGHIERIRAGSMPPLSQGFAERYNRATAGHDDPSAFCTKAQLLDEYHRQRAGTLKLLDEVTAEDLDLPTGIDYAPTNAALFILQGTHWLMHAGQWAVVRRQQGRPPLF